MEVVESPAVRGANGASLRPGARVQTENTIEEGGDGDWYPGTVTLINPALGHVSIEYDDGDSWTGPAAEVQLLPEKPLLQPGPGCFNRCSRDAKKCLFLGGVGLFCGLFVLDALLTEVQFTTGETALWYDIPTCKSGNDAASGRPRYDLRIATADQTPSKSSTICTDLCSTLRDGDCAPRPRSA